MAATKRPVRAPAPQGIGPAVDAAGNQLVDPSENVKALSEAANKRQDDLREVTDLLNEERIRRLEQAGEHIKQVSEIRELHAKEMRVSEAARLDSIRQVDVTAVRTEATRALEAIQTLAATSARDAETLRTALVNTATTIASQTSETVKQITERIAALEKSSYEGVGKSRLADPAFDQLLVEVKGLRESRSAVTGRTEGSTATWALVVVGAGLLLTVASIGIPLLVNRSAPAPVVIERTSATQGTTAP